MASAGVAANDKEKIDTLQLKLNKLERELEALRKQVDEVDEAEEADEPGKVKAGVDGVSLAISGHVNRGILVTDDGDDTDAFFVDNDNSSTRINLTGETAFDETLKVGAVIEVQFESNSTADISQDNKRNAGDDNFTERKLEIYGASEDYGKLWLGQGSTASDGTSEVDLSNTSVVGYSSVADFAGGIQFADDGDLSGTDIGDSFSNQDGLGRDDRIRYDSPDFYHSTLSLGAAADDRYDIALRYKQDLYDTHTFAAAIAYENADDDFEGVNGSASLLFGKDRLKGLNVTVAAGMRDLDAGGRNNANFVYGKLGYRFTRFTIGETALAVDYYYGEDIDDDGDESTTFGLLAVQVVDSIGTELYGGLRNYDLDRDGESFDDINAFLVGGRVKF